MSLLQKLKDSISPTHPFRLLYHHVLAVLAAIYYRFPSRYLHVVGVTGTKGKTTTTNLVTVVLQQAGYKVGMSSTIAFQVGDQKWANASKITTLGPFFLQKLLRQMVDERCTHAVLEVSSHAISQNRIWGINFDTAVFTNIGEDHLEYHGGFENYLRTKGILFDRLNRSARKRGILKSAVLNKDDPDFAYFDQFLVDRKFLYGVNGGTCYATNIQLQPSGSMFTLHVPNNQTDIHLKLPGQFNVYNALAAATVALANNINVTVIKEALEQFSSIPGRFESIDAGQPFGVIVDYAHTEDSLQKLLAFYRELTKGKVFIVFGATGGGRDRSKRPKMGAVAAKYADYIIVTDDDPYEEDRWQIIQDVSSGIQRSEGDRFWKIPTREEALKFALNMAKEGDTVLIAGKGAEQFQMVEGGKISWDDRQKAREILTREMEVAL